MWAGPGNDKGRAQFVIAANKPAARWVPLYPRIALTLSAICAGSITGSEQRSPMQTNAAASPAALIFACAGCVGGSASAVGARNTMRSTNGSLQRRGVSASRRRALARDHDLGAAQPQVERVEQRQVHEQVVGRDRQQPVEQPVGLRAPGVLPGQHRQPHQVLRRDRIGIRRRLVGAWQFGRTTSPSASSAVRK